jgi:aryl-alcohol dehydrogenase-like predicted oxidoreductase
MEYRRVGHSGLVVSTLGLGCSAFGRRADEPGRTVLADDRAREVLRAAFDCGITLYDTADSYGESEVLLGRYLGSHRDDIVIATKFGHSVKGALGVDYGARGARRYVRRAVERSLRRLGTDWIDLYQMHSPDPLTPIEETLDVLTDLVQEGKVRYLGSSNFAAWEIAHAQARSASAGRRERFVSAQNHFSLLARGIERDIQAACLQYGIGLITLRPLAEGLLTGKYRVDGGEGLRRPRALTPQVQADLLALRDLAQRWDTSMLNLAIGGLAAQPTVASVIAGATSAQQVSANAAAAGWTLGSAALSELDTLTRGIQALPQAPDGRWLPAR